MTKAELIKALEAFTDDIEITVSTSLNLSVSPVKVKNSYYALDEYGAGIFVLVIPKQNKL